MGKKAKKRRRDVDGLEFDDGGGIAAGRSTHGPPVATVKKFNLNEESLFLEIDSKLLNG